MNQMNNKRIIQIENADGDTIHDLLTSLATNEELHFFDYYHPQWSDPGAYITVIKYNDEYIYKMGNHGWSSDWHSIDIHRLTRYMFKNRGHQDNGIYIQEIINKIKLTDNEPTSEMFWEDKLKLVFRSKNRFSVFEVNGYHLIYIHHTSKAYALFENEEKYFSLDNNYTEKVYTKYYTDNEKYKDRIVTIKWNYK